MLSIRNFQPTIGPDGKRIEPESNVLLASIENMQYAVTVEVINTVRIYIFQWNFLICVWIILCNVGVSLQVFSAFGTVQKIAMFEKNGQTQALVQYPGINPICLLVLEFVLYVPVLLIYNTISNVYMLLFP